MCVIFLLLVSVPSDGQKDVDENHEEDCQKNSSNTGKQEHVQKTAVIETRITETKGETSQKICPEKIKNASESVQVVKMKTQEPAAGKQSGDVGESCQTTVTNDAARTRSTEAQSIKDVTAQLGDFHKGERKKTKQQEEKSLDEDVDRVSSFIHL